MNLLERVRSIFAASPTVEHLEAAERDLDAALVASKAESAERWRAHNARALEWISIADPAPGNRSRAKCDEADRRVSDLTAALKDARDRLERARKARSESDAAAAWQASADLLRARGEAMARLQALLVSAAEEHGKVLDLGSSAWQSLPVKPASWPKTYSPGSLSACMQLFLFGASAGRLGAAPSSAYVASRQHDLITQDHEASLMLMAPRPVAAAAVEEVATP